MTMRVPPFLTLVGGTAVGRAVGVATPLVQIALQDHIFFPEIATAPSGRRFRIELTNLDPTITAFESAGMGIAATVPGWDKISVLVGPLPPGRYEFFDEFHPDTAQGAIVVSDAGRG